MNVETTGTGSCIICASEMSAFKVFVDTCRDCQERKITRERLEAAITWMLVGTSTGFAVGALVF